MGVRRASWDLEPEAAVGESPAYHRTADTHCGLGRNEFAPSPRKLPPSAYQLPAGLGLRTRPPDGQTRSGRRAWMEREGEPGRPVQVPEGVCACLRGDSSARQSLTLVDPQIRE